MSILLFAGLAVIAGHVKNDNDNSLTVAPAPGSPTVTKLQLQPLPTETMVMGPGGRPIVWADRPSNGLFSLTAVPNGVDLTFQRDGYDDWAAPTVMNFYGSTEVAGRVRFVSGPTQDNIGVGCASQDGSVQIGFRVTEGSNWSLIYFPPGDGQLDLLDSGTNQAILPTTSVNNVEILCATGPSGENTQIMAAVNGVPVANDVIGVLDEEWSPAIDQCSCYGVATGEFTQLAQYGWN